MGNLITLSTIKEFRPVSANLATDRIDYAISDAQEFDIKPVLGPALYLAFINGLAMSPQTSIYIDLFEGKTYLQKGINENISFKGVRAALAYYSYARLLLNQDLHITASGIVHKDEQWSKLAEEKRIQSQVTAARAAAGAIEVDYVRFLNDNSTDYPIWTKTCIVSATVKGGINISRVTSGGFSQRSGPGDRCGCCGYISRYCIC